MRIRVTVFTTALVAALTLSPAGMATHTFCPAASDPSQPGHSEFAQAHVRVLAQGGMLGEGGHRPGEHRGMSGCHPEQNRP
jgi:hypothetical protein